MTPHDTRPAVIRRQRSIIAVVMLLLLIAGMGVPADRVLADDGASVMTSVTVDGFAFIDGTRPATLTTNGWCPTAERQLVDRACDPETGSSAAVLRHATVGFDAYRRVTSNPPSTGGFDRRVELEVQADVAGVYELAILGGQVDGTNFRVDDTTAIPSPTSFSPQAAVWVIPLEAGESASVSTEVFTEPGPGVRRATPAMSVTVDRGSGEIAATHLRGAISAEHVPGGVSRTDQMTFPARISGPPLPPVASMGDLVVESVEGALIVSGAGQVTVPNDVAEGQFDDQYDGRTVTLPVLPGGGFSYTVSASNLGDASRSTGAGEFRPDDGFAELGILAYGDAPGGIPEGYAGGSTIFLSAKTAAPFDTDDDPRQPRDDDGQLVLDWDGVVRDQTAFLDRRAEITTRDGMSDGETPDNAILTAAYGASLSMEGGDQDRRDDPIVELSSQGLLGVPSDRGEAQIFLDSPEGWQAIRIFVGTFAPADVQGGFVEDGDAQIGFNVGDGEYWLESVPGAGPAGADSWTWGVNIVVDAMPDEKVLTSTEFGGDPVGQLIRQHVPPGHVYSMWVMDRSGPPRAIELGPGTHEVVTGPDGALDARLVAPSAIPRGV